MARPARAVPEHGIALSEAVRVWARIAALSFGGPAGQIAVMHRILVEEKRWIGEERFLHALNYCMLLPGPEAQQLATYIGWLLHRTRGGLIAGALFVLPGFLAILGLSFAYALLGNVPVIAGLFFGLKAAVIAIVLQAVVRVASRSLKSGALRFLAVAAFLAIFLFNVPFPLIILAAGLIGYFGARAGISGLKGGSGHGAAGNSPFHDAGHVLTKIALFFSQMAVVTFGGAYAVLAYVAQQAVGTFGWLRPNEMIDGLGMAETTPGPLIMVTQFVGFMGAMRHPGGLDPLVAATIGAVLTTWVTFVPCFLWIFLGAPFVERLRGNRALSASLTAITAAVVGVILNLAVWFSLHALFGNLRAVEFAGARVEVPVWSSLNIAAVALTAFSIIALSRLKLSVPLVLALAAAGGVALRLAGLA